MTSGDSFSRSHSYGSSKTSPWWLRVVGTLNQAAWLGLSLFFVLSGYLITGNLWDGRRDERRARNFYVRRVLRIFPLYYFALLLVLAGAVAWGTLGRAMHAIWIPALFLQTVPSLSERVQQMPSPMLLHHFWSLAVEEQFYLLWPWIVWRKFAAESDGVERAGYPGGSDERGWRVRHGGGMARQRLGPDWREPVDVVCDRVRGAGAVATGSA